MLHGEKVVLRAMKREDLTRQCAFNNDLEFELAGGGDPPEPQALARIEAQFDEDLRRGERDGMNFAIEATCSGNCSNSLAKVLTILALVRYNV